MRGKEVPDLRRNKLWKIFEIEEKEGEERVRWEKFSLRGPCVCERERREEYVI